MKFRGRRFWLFDIFCNKNVAFPIFLLFRKVLLVCFAAMSLCWSDTHCHLYLPEFREDLHQTLERAMQAGVTRFFLPNIDVESTASMFRLSADYAGVIFPMIGLHPCSVKEDREAQLQQLKSLAFDESLNISAIGEIGLDYYWDTTFADKQREVFRTQIQWAKSLHLPIVIHVRDSFEDAIQIVKEENSEALRGVFHCFSGGVKEAEEIADLGGFKIGIGGVVTFKNSTLSETLKSIPLELIVLETDSPYLAPVPYRGKRNESAYIPIIAQKVAESLQIPLARLSEITQQNTRELFGV
jgi:TatD DNase family protein